jgi:HD-GYP domain-containing protein (c-di-GMP phosphodiesterase class II)
VIVPLISRNKVIGVLGADKTGDEEVTDDDRDCLGDFSNEIAIAIENAQLYEHLNTSYVSSVQALAKALEAKDSYTRGHSSRVADYAVQIGKTMGLSEKELDEMRQACLLHDVGKIGITESLLHKKGPLTESEREEFCLHPIIGEEILKPLLFFSEQTAIIRNHHEWYNGHGYPDQLSGSSIPLEARIVAVADAYDAMTSDRAYRPALPREEAIQEISRCANTQFDPFVASAFVRALSGEADLEAEELHFRGERHEAAKLE